MATTVETIRPEQAGRSERVWRWLTWQRVPAARIRLLQPKRETVALLTYPLVYVAFSALTGLVIRQHPVPILGASSFTSDAQYVLGFKFVGLLVIPAIWFSRSGYRTRDLLPEWQPGLRTLLTASLALLFGVYINAGHLAGIWQAAPNFDSAALALRLLVATLIPLFTAALPEEFVYRGLLQTRLELLTGRAAALVITAAMFTAWHLPSRFLLAAGSEGRAGDWASVLLHTGLPVCLVGLVIGWLWDRYCNLAMLVALHWGIDLLPSISSLLAVPLGGPHR